PSGSRILDQRGKPLVACRLLFGADDPPGRAAPVARRLCLPETPCVSVRLELLEVLRWEVGRAVLVGVDPGPILGARLEGGDAGRVHAPFGHELADPRDIPRAPRAALAPRREAVGVDLVAD